MAKKRIFQIKSKEDAGFFATEIKHYDSGFHYYLPLMGVNGGMRTVRWYPERDIFCVATSTPGWENREEGSLPDTIEYLWKDRKLINAELRYIESA